MYWVMACPPFGLIPGQILGDFVIKFGMLTFMIFNWPVADAIHNGTWQLSQLYTQLPLMSWSPFQ